MEKGVEESQEGRIGERKFRNRERYKKGWKEKENLNEREIER